MAQAVRRLATDPVVRDEILWTLLGLVLLATFIALLIQDQAL